jgi:cytochrome c peroxidase
MTAGALALLGFAATAAQAEEKYPERDEARSAAQSEAPSATITVEPGQSIQAAVDRAAPGDRIQLLPGVYHESVMIDFDDITLIGLVEDGRRAVLDGKGEMNDAILVSGHNFTIQGIEMRNYKANGVVVNQANNVVFRDLVGVNTGKYAVYPVQCDGVLIEGCVVSDVWDAGVYAGQCKNVEIRNNVTYRNTIGIEAENSVNVLIHNNTTFDNSLGILVVLLPNLPSKEASDALVVNNRVLNNNYPNLAPEGEIVSMVTPGQGIMVNAADRTEVTNNEVAGHDSFGVVVASLLDSMEAQDAGRDIGGRLDKIDVEPNPDNNLIHGNHYARNGEGELSPIYRAGGMTKGADILWTGRGTGNVFNEPGATTFPPVLPGPAASAEAEAGH